ncbi:MAG: hypothetical protein AAGC99_18380 [Pseudomonadota bacterium]
MTSPAMRVPSTLSSATLDKLFLDCAELETLITSIRQTFGALGPAVDSGLVTPEHLMNLAFRIENAERGLIEVSHQIDNTATTVIERRKRGATAPQGHNCGSFTQIHKN